LFLLLKLIKFKYQYYVADSCKLPCGVAPGFKHTDPYTLVSNKNLLKDWPPKDQSGNVHAVIEISAGRTEK